MRKALSCLLFVSWALWLGGMIGLFLFVMRLFQTSRNLGVLAAPVLFEAFDTYQLILGMIACAAGTLVAIKSLRKAHAIITLLMIGSLALALVIRSWSREMLLLDRTIPQQAERFQYLHHATTNVYSTSACLLLAAGIGWVVTLLGNEWRQKSGGTAPAINSQVATADRSPVG